jgi:hypothetical protein
VYVKGRGPLMSFIVGAAGRLLIAPNAAAPTLRIFKKKIGEHSSESVPTHTTPRRGQDSARG